VPGEPIDWSYAGPILIGVVVTIIVGEVLMILARNEKKQLEK
jgi:uncharacterized membrane-anchored protein YhcB (DUF1043 family)